MTTAILADRFRALGFTDGDWFRDLTDKPIKGLAYLTRVHKGRHQYVSLCSGPWEGAPFTEAVLLVYREPFNGRAKVRQTPLAARIVRDLDELDRAVGAIY